MRYILSFLPSQVPDLHTRRFHFFVVTRFQQLCGESGRAVPPVAAGMPMQREHHLSATTAQDVTTELFVLLRCVRETRRHGAEAVAFAASERVLVDELPQFVSVIGNRGADKHRRMVALGQIAKSLAYVASSKEIMLLSKFDETGLLKVIITWCLEVPPDDLFVLGNGLTILSNVAFMAHTNMVVEAGAAELLVRLLCHDGHAGAGGQHARSASPEVTAYAAAALSNLVADAYGASSFSAEQRAHLLLVLGAMSDAQDLTLRGYILSAAKNLKRVVDALSPAQLEALRKKTDRKHKKAREIADRQIAADASCRHVAKPHTCTPCHTVHPRSRSTSAARAARAARPCRPPSFAVSARSSGCSAAGEGGATGGSQRPCSSRCTPRPLSSRSTRARARSAATSSRPSTGVPRRARSTRRSYGRTLRRASSASSSGTASCARRCATRWGRSSTTAGRRRRSAARASSLPKGAVLDAPQLTTLTFWLTT